MRRRDFVGLRELSPGETVLDARDASGKGIAITSTDRFTLQISMSDGHVNSAWDCDPGTHAGTVRVGAWQHLAVIVDGGPKIVTSPNSVQKTAPFILQSDTKKKRQNRTHERAFKHSTGPLVNK